jgi:two-component system, cell cycle response regulator CpdR
MSIEMNEEASRTPASPATFRSLRCLLVDDDPFLRMLIADILRDMGHQAAEAADPDTALAMLHAETYDVLLTDMRLPYMDGTELAMRARRAYPNLRVIFATAYSESRLPDLTDDPLARYLRKPFGQKEIDDALQSLGYCSSSDSR